MNCKICALPPTHFKEHCAPLIHNCAALTPPLGGILHRHSERPAKAQHTLYADLQYNVYF